MKYQTIAKVPAGTDMTALPEVFQGIAQAMEILPVCQARMAGTRDYNGEMLVLLEIKNVTAAAQVMQFLAGGIGAAFGQTWTVIAAQDTYKTPDVDADGNPVMVQVGTDDNGDPIMVRSMSVKVAIPLSESLFINFMPDVPDEVDVEGNVLTWKRPTVAAPAKISGAEDWVMVA